MFAVFAGWAVFGFAFPSEPLPFPLNDISKVLCFVAAIMLFVWHESEFTTAELKNFETAAGAYRFNGLSGAEIRRRSLQGVGTLAVRSARPE
jgi:hypothetical protein